MDWTPVLILSSDDFRGVTSRRMVRLAVLAVALYLGTGISYNLLKIQLVRHWPVPATQAEAGPASTTTVREPVQAYRIVTERNLFETTAQSIAAPRGAPPPQDISLLFELRGTVADEGGHGFAVVEEKGSSKQRLVKVGGTISGAKVLRVRRNALDVRIDGQERTLKIVEGRREPSLPAAPAAVRPVPPPGGAIIVNRSEIEARLQDMGSMLRQAQIRPYFSAGVQEGFLVTNIQPGSFYQQMGIRNGDVIQGINNQNIRTAEDVVALYHSLKNASTLSLSVRRSGRQEMIHYQFR